VKTWRSLVASRAAPLLLVAAAYYGSAELGLRLALVGDSVTPLWPATGVAVVAYLALGLSVWPAIAVAAFAVNLPIGPNAASAGAIAIGNTVAPLLAALLLRRFGFRWDLSRLRDAMLLVVVALSTMTISAWIGTGALAASDGLAGKSVLDTWWVWWTGDAMGVLIVAPFLWSLWPVRLARPRFVAVVEATAVFAALAAVTVVASRSEDSVLFVVFPLLVWIAWRFQRRGAGVAALFVSVVVAVAAADSRGPFAHDMLLTKMAVLQLFNAAVSLTTFVFAAAVTERRRAMEQLYRREHDLAETLQESLLPMAMPEVPSIELCGRYTPAQKGANIGGDWYDVFPLAHERLGVAVGDVVGHGVTAAAAMAELRAALRAYAHESTSPGAVLSRLNHLTLELHPHLMATVFYGVFDVVDNSFWFATAGHPYPLRISPSGEPSYLDGPIGPAIGISDSAEYAWTCQTLDHFETVVAFTDGLIERRDRPMDQGLERLARVARGLTRSLEETCDFLVASLVDENDVADDVAMIAIRPRSFAGERVVLRRPNQPSTVAEVRRFARRWLTDNGASPDDIDDLVLATSEAHTNAVNHAYNGRTGMVVIEFDAEDDDAVITIRDHGTWRVSAEFFDARKSTAGRGLGLMNALTDTVQIASGATGTEVRLRRRLGARASTY
jgi:integral membrane sensor domain MASE1/anti-sigma regulatory factor (Ser/Thr protein kinase)